MITGRPKKPIVLSEEEREQLNAIVNSRSLPYRARAVLASMEQSTQSLTVAFDAVSGYGWLWIMRS